MRGKFLRENWLGVVGLVIGIIGLLASWYTYERSRRYRDPVFVLDPARTEIISRERMSGTPIRVTKADGRPVTSDLTSVRFYFWNDGSESLRANDVLEPLVISILDPQAEILDLKVLHRSRAVTGLTITPAPSQGRAAALVKFSILENRDGCTGQIIYEGNPKAAIVLKGTVEGARIRGSSDLAASRQWYEYFKGVGWLILGMTLLVGQILFEKLPAWFQKLPAGRLKKSLELVGVSLLIAIALLIVAGVVWGLFIGGVKAARERASNNVVQSVPEEVRPSR